MVDLFVKIYKLYDKWVFKAYAACETEAYWTYVRISTASVTTKTPYYL